MKPLSQLLLLMLLLFSCESTSIEQDYSHIPSAFEIQITIPAGTVSNPSFLPYIGNFGNLDKAERTSVLVLSAAEKIGKKMMVRPLGVLILKEKKRVKNIIIATPLDSTKQLTTTSNFQEFIARNAGEKQIIQDWFLYQKGLGKVELVGWKDEKYAFSLINNPASRE